MARVWYPRSVPSVRAIIVRRKSVGGIKRFWTCRRQSVSSPVPRSRNEYWEVGMAPQFQDQMGEEMHGSMRVSRDQSGGGLPVNKLCEWLPGDQT